MLRTSASGIAYFFENYPLYPRKKTAPGAFLLDTVFPSGHVREHDAIHYLSRCDGIQIMSGQNGYARAFEYLEGNLLALWKRHAWLLANNRGLFNDNMADQLGEKLLNAKAAKIAVAEQSVLLLIEDRIGRQCLREMTSILAAAADLSTEEAFRQHVVVPCLAAARRWVFQPVGYHGELGYTVKGIPYTLPRYSPAYGNATVICQPDGFCLASGKRTVVEIKSPQAGHYTSLAVGNKSAQDRQKLWVKYLIQIAVEMDVTQAEQALLLSWYGHTGRVVVLSRALMGPLIGHVKSWVAQLGLTGEPYANTAFFKLVRKPASMMTVTDIQEELAQLEWSGTAPKRKKDWATALEQARGPRPPTYYDVVSQELAAILAQLTASGDAFVPLEDVFPVHALDQFVATLADQGQFKTFVQ